MMLRVLVSVAVGASALAAGMVAPTAGAVPAAAATSPISWSACSIPGLTEFECGTLTVPRDWGNPAVGTFDLAVYRSPSTGSPAERIGSLFFNPGGPGGAGLDAMPVLADLVPESLHRRFDIVTWDPRGVGRSAPVIDCEPAQWAVPPAVGEVDWAAFAVGVREAVRTVNSECLARFPDVAPYVGTNNVVRDLDALRAAVGDRRLTYWGVSYGTRIGYVYALTYPDRFRALLLDGPISPRGSIADFSLGYSTASDPAVGFIFENFPGVKWRYQRILGALQQEPLQLSPTRAYTQWDLGYELEQYASSQAMMPDLARHLRQIDQAIFGTPVEQRRARSALAKLPPTGPPFAMSALPAVVNCLDYADRQDAAQMDQMGAEIRFNAPITGWVRAMQIPPACLGLESLTPDPVPLAQGNNWSSRILLLSASRDGQTPYRWATAMANAFRSAPLVTYIGNQHVTFRGAASPCVDGYASRFLLRGDVPRMDVACNNVRLRSDGR